MQAHSEYRQYIAYLPSWFKARMGVSKKNFERCNFGLRFSGPNY
jgi:hypothetical protein